MIERFLWNHLIFVAHFNVLTTSIRFKNDLFFTKNYMNLSSFIIIENGYKTYLNTVSSTFYSQKMNDFLKDSGINCSCYLKTYFLVSSTFLF